MNRIVIDANKGKFSLNIRELIEYRDLLLVLAYRDLRVRYAQTFLGLLWAFIQPLTTLLIFVLIFGRVIKIETEGIPYPLFAITGLACWSYFSYVLNQSGNSIILAQEMIKKIYFPRLIIPISKAVVAMVDFAVALILLLVLGIYYDLSVSSNLLFLPLFIVFTILASLGIGIWLTALTLRFRDFQHIVPFLVQVGLYISPIAFPASIITQRLPEWASYVYYLNPVAGLVNGFRWCILNGAPPDQYSYLSFAVILLIFFTSLIYFSKVEKIMADVI